MAVPQPPWRNAGPLQLAARPNPCHESVPHTPNNAMGWYADAPVRPTLMSNPISTQSSRCSASTNATTNRTGWSFRAISSGVGGITYTCYRPVGRSGISNNLHSELLTSKSTLMHKPPVPFEPGSAARPVEDAPRREPRRRVSRVEWAGPPLSDGPRTSNSRIALPPPPIENPSPFPLP